MSYDDKKWHNNQGWFFSKENRVQDCFVDSIVYLSELQSYQLTWPICYIVSRTQRESLEGQLLWVQSWLTRWFIIFLFEVRWDIVSFVFQVEFQSRQILHYISEFIYDIMLKSFQRSDFIYSKHCILLAYLFSSSARSFSILILMAAFIFSQ